MSVPVPYHDNPFQSDPRLLSSLLTSSMTAVGVTDADGHLLFANDALIRMWGYPEGEPFAGRHLSEFWVEEGIRDFVSSLAKSGQAVGEGLGRRKDGTLFNVQYVADLIRDDDGRPIYMFGTFLDVTEQKRTLKALKRSEATFNGLFRAAPIGIGLVTDRIFRFVNRTMCEMTGYGSEELVGRSARILYDSDEEYERVGRVKYDEIAEHGTGSVETRFVRKGGGSVDVLLSSSPIHPDNLSSGVIFTAMDISDRKRAETALRESEARLRQAVKMEAVGQLAGGLAHDFNNLLMAITSYTDLLDARLGPDHEFARYTQGILQTVDRATGLVKKILAFGRKQMLQPRVIKLNTVVHDMEGMLRRTIPENIRLETSFTSPLPSVHADPNQIEQVIVNLAINARDAMRGSGTLKISTAAEEHLEPDAQVHPGLRPGEYVVLSVADDGSGMDGDTQSRIFEPFFTTKNPGQGTGLGLAQVWGIVKQSDGFIYVDSQLGVGTTFRVFLPAVDELDSMPPAHEAKLSTIGGSETVLVAEDDSDVRAAITEGLTGFGYRVLEATDGDNAVEVAREHSGRIHALVTDMVMPGMAVEDLVEGLTDDEPLLRVVYITGYSVAALEVGEPPGSAAALLQKPFSLHELATTLRRVLDE